MNSAQSCQMCFRLSAAPTVIAVARNGLSDARVMAVSGRQTILTPISSASGLQARSSGASIEGGERGEGVMEAMVFDLMTKIFREFGYDESTSAQASAWLMLLALAGAIWAVIEVAA